MKIAMLSTMYLRYEHDTRGLMVSEVCRNLIQEGMEIHVVAPGDATTPPYQLQKGVHVHRFFYFWPKKLQCLAYGAGIPTNLRNSWFARFQIPFFAFFFWLKTLSIGKTCDLVHAQWLPPGLIGCLARPFVKKKVIVTVRRIKTRGPLSFFDKYVLNHADHVFFNSSYTQKESLKIAKPKSSSVVHNSIDLEKFKPIPNARERLGIPKEAVVLFTMGLLVEKKGFPYLIKAIPSIVQKVPKCCLIIGGSGPGETELRKLITELGLQKQVLLAGTISSDRTPLYYNAADLFVLPSIVDSKGDTETLGVVLLEALACKTPVVASAVGGIPDIVTKEVGKLVPEKDPEALSAAIIELLKKPDLLSSLGEAGRKHVEIHFTWAPLRKQIIQKYEELLS